MDKIIHVDMDAFFASVEIIDNPLLKGKPVIVGGGEERGVVTTCSYEARKFGVQSAMPGLLARKLCPNGIFLPVRHYRYREVSNQVFDILYSFTDLIEPLSIDEAYLDITDLDKDPIEIANEIKKRVKEETGLTISVGVSYNKFLAKIASDWNKPDGLKVITKDMIPEILLPLPIKKVYGIGKKSVSKLNSIGVYTIDDLYRLDKDFLLSIFGKYGLEIYDRIRGIDNRDININRERKSIGRETTLDVDTKDKEILTYYIKEFCDDIHKSIVKRELKFKTITIKIKTKYFQSHTRSRTLSNFIHSYEELYNISKEILNEIELEDEVRLIGVSVSNFSDFTIEQLNLFDINF